MLMAAVCVRSVAPRNVQSTAHPPVKMHTTAWYRLELSYCILYEYDMRYTLSIVSGNAVLLWLIRILRPDWNQLIDTQLDLLHFKSISTKVAYNTDGSLCNSWCRIIYARTRSWRNRYVTSANFSFGSLKPVLNLLINPHQKMYPLWG